jgi:hypothetical protein
MALVYLGGALVLVAQVWVLVMAFQQSVVWGLLVLCLPFMGLVFCIINWGSAKRAVLLYVAGAIIGGIGSARLKQRGEWVTGTETAQSRIGTSMVSPSLAIST